MSAPTSSAGTVVPPTAMGADPHPADARPGLRAVSALKDRAGKISRLSEADGETATSSGPGVESLSPLASERLAGPFGFSASEATPQQEEVR